MDKALFVGMNGQTSALRELEILSNNLANVNTPGFRADYESVKQHAVKGSKLETRVYSTVGSSYTDFKQGPVLRTGRDLDLAVSGHGMFAVQSATGKEGYTRAGNFDLSSDGFLKTSRGELVLGTNGVVQIPNAEKIQIGQDGTVSAKPIGASDMVVVGKLKLVSVDPKHVEKGVDGLFYTKDGGALEQDMNIKVQSGSLEGSNVSPVDTLIKLIDLTRQYEIHANFIKNMSEQSVESNKLLDLKV